MYNCTTSSPARLPAFCTSALWVVIKVPIHIFQSEVVDVTCLQFNLCDPGDWAVPEIQFDDQVAVQVKPVATAPSDAEFVRSALRWDERPCPADRKGIGDAPGDRRRRFPDKVNRGIHSRQRGRAFKSRVGVVGRAQPEGELALGCVAAEDVNFRVWEPVSDHFQHQMPGSPESGQTESLPVS